MTKLTILFLGLAIFVSLWLIPERRWYRQPWIWLAALIAVPFVIPYAHWQWTHGWYFLSYAATYSGRTSHTAPVMEFLWHQFLPNNPATAPVWLTGLLLLLFRKSWTTYRFFAYCYIVLFVAVFAVGGQFYFMIPMYGILIAAGSVGIEQWFDRGREEGRPRLALRVAIPVFYVLLSLPILPYFVPVLPVDTLIEYLRPVGVTAGIKTEDSEIRDLPQHIADRFGWEELALEVARVYHEARDSAGGDIGIAASDWGEAAALHVHGATMGLPEPISTDGWYYFETLRHNEFRDRYVVVGDSPAQLRSLFEHVELKAVFTHRYCRPNENNNPICLCAGPRVNLRQYWIVAHRMNPAFEEVVRVKGVEEAVAYYRSCREKDSTVLLFSESQLNRLGYTYLRRGQTQEALAVFRLNIEAYPWSSNVYDSYAEALMANRQYDLADRNYRRSLELDPGNRNATKKLKELESAPQ
jgi:hypothetical protein